MGLKRRAAGRKQVLNLNEKQDSPRRSWQTKYQQICVEHNTKNGSSPDTGKGTATSTSKNVSKTNPLSGLLANYHSDSDADDDEVESNATKDLDSKVSDFLKEIQTIVPSGSSIVVPGQLITTPGIVDVSEAQQQQATVSAWQECYDETTGYIYYWHTETNAVTWETPAEYLPQSMSASQGADVLGHHDSASLQLGLAAAAHQSGLHQVSHDMHAWSHPGVPIAYPMMGLGTGLIPQAVQAPGNNGTSGTKEIKPLVEYNSKSTDKASSDSEEEKIEMITSFGESSDEESEEEIKPPVKRKKVNVDRTGSQFDRTLPSRGKQNLIGPKLESFDDHPTSQPDSEQIDEGSNLLSNKVDDFGPPGVEIETKTEDVAMGSHEKTTDALQSISPENTSADSELETENDKIVTSVAAANENSCGAELALESVTYPRLGTTSVGSDGEDSAETDEFGILSRLRTQAKVLRELGGELPAEVQQLIEPAEVDTSDDVIEKSEEAQKSESVEKAPVLVEHPPMPGPEPSSTLPDFEKEMERMEEELKELTKISSITTNVEKSQASTSVESSPKTTSFALIAGYGEDSDQEDENEKVPIVEPPVIVQKRTFESLPTVPVKSLFPIAEHISVTEPKSPPSFKSENSVLDSEELHYDKPVSPKVSHSILFPSVDNSTEVPLPALRLQESNEVGLNTEQTLPSVEPIIDSTLPKRASKRKKRLDISTSAELVAASSKSSVAVWTYSESEFVGVERKGLGFQKLETDADAFLQNCMTEFESTKVLLPKNKESIAFVKGDVLNAPKPVEEAKEEETDWAPEQNNEPEANMVADEESSKLMNDLAQIILEKVTFLAEGKEPPSPVQVMAIQIETLVSAWHVGALSHTYLSKWLGETGDELGRLETSAAPEGWACQWDRSHKRYYYCNLLTGKTQWEYPETLEEITEPEPAPVVAKEEEEEEVEQPNNPQVPAAEDIAGGELAMEICNTPPHSPSPSPSPPSPATPPRVETPPPPPPPTISETDQLSPPPPPRISPFSPPKSSDRRRTQKGKNKKKKLNNKKQQPDKKRLKDDSPTSSPPDMNPPLPPLPPPPSSPPPPPPSEMPPLPPSPPCQQLAYGEPLPPGVDPGELPYMAHQAPAIYQPPEVSPPLTADVDTYQHAMQTTYVMAPYQATLVQAGMGTNVQGGPVIDYAGMPYMMHPHMPMPAVIAKPPAKKHKASLHAALDSFYSDLATMEPVPTPEGVTIPTVNPVPVADPIESVPVTTSEPFVEPDVPVAKPVDTSAKKKKVKKVVGLGLKKKGVSTLVAKWQQVQQEVRRDFETLDQDNKNSQ